MIKDMLNKEVGNKEIEKLRVLFPHLFDKNGSFNIGEFNKLLVDHEVDFTNESYALNWLGKSYSKILSSLETESVLIPYNEDNQLQDNINSKNVYIEGDNLDALKHLNKSYVGSVKMIYIDPPYNTGNDGFTYNDKFNFSVGDLAELASISEEQASKILSMKNAHSNSHSAWLTFMYPRLYIARNLLSDNGVMFISIDDNECDNLSMLCKEIFGPNKVEKYIWNVADFEESTFQKTASKTVRFEHEYIIACYKGEKNLDRYTEYRYIDRDDLFNIDNDPRGPWMSGNISRNAIKTTTGEKYYTITTPTSIEYTRNWTISKDEFEELDRDNRIFYSKNGDGVPRLKIFQNEPSMSIQSSLFSNLKTSITGKNQIKELFSGEELFSFPKPTNLIKRLCVLCDTKNEVVLDFFSGSATTAQAIMELNACDGGNRSYIMVNLPEETTDSSQAHIEGYGDICEFAKERIRRAASKIKEETKAEIDYGFKTFKCVDISKEQMNMIDKFEPNLLLGDTNVLKEFGVETVLYTWGLEDGAHLSDNITKIDFDGYEAYSLNENTIYLLNPEIEERNIKSLIEKFDNDKACNFRKVVLFGYSFGTNDIKNIKDNLKQLKYGKKAIDIDVEVRY